jgi:hypothetical protein
MNQMPPHAGQPEGISPARSARPMGGRGAWKIREDSGRAPRISRCVRRVILAHSSPKLPRRFIASGDFSTVTYDT